MNKALEHEPFFVQALVERSTILLQVYNRPEESLTDCLNVLSTHPSHAVAKYLQASVLSTQRNVATAIALLQENVEQNPKHIPSHELLAHLIMASENGSNTSLMLVPNVVDVLNNALLHADIHEQAQIIATKALYLLSTTEYDASIHALEVHLQFLNAQKMKTQEDELDDEIAGLVSLRKICRDVKFLLNKYGTLMKHHKTSVVDSRIIGTNNS